jgi:hypothetical protein
MDNLGLIHPVTGAEVDSQLRDTFANRLNISGISSGEPFDPRLDARSRLDVAQVVEPLSEECGFADFDHKATVAIGLHIVNAIPPRPEVPNGTELSRAAEGGVGWSEMLARRTTVNSYPSFGVLAVIVFIYRFQRISANGLLSIKTLNLLLHNFHKAPVSFSIPALLPQRKAVGLCYGTVPKREETRR